MTRLTRLSLAHRTVVLLLAVLIVGIGIYATGTLKQELIPSMDLPRGVVVGVYPGANPQSVEQEVTLPIESAVKGVSGVDSVTSTSSSGVAQVTFQWEYGLDVTKLANDVSTAVDKIKATLPSTVTTQVVTGSMDDLPVVLLAVSWDGDTAELATKVDDIVAPELKTVPGVRDAAVSGGVANNIVITLDQAKLDKYSIDPSTVSAMFAAGSMGMPSGTVKTSDKSLDVQVGATMSSAKDLAGLMIPTSDKPVKLSQIATVTEGPADAESISRVNGRPALTIAVTKNASGNTVSVAHGVTDKLDALAAQLGNGARFDTVFTQAPYIENSIRDLSSEGGIGLVMAIVVIMIFLWALRPTLITAVSIPLSLLIAMVGLYIGANTLNILTLGALTVAIGRVVDDSIVVIENIERHQGLGHWGRPAIVDAVKEVAGAVTSSTLTTVAVFLPIGIVGGQAGEMFRPFAVTIAISLGASLLVALTVVPVLASGLMRPTPRRLAKLEAKTSKGPRDTIVQRIYTPVLTWALAHRALTLALAFAIFAGTLGLTSHLKTDFIGSMGQETLSITKKLPAGTPLPVADESARQVEAVLAADPAVQTYATSVGGGGSMAALFGGSGSSSISFTISLKPGSDVAAATNRIRQALGDVMDSNGVQVQEGSSTTTSQAVLYVEGSDETKLKQGSDQVLAMMNSIQGLTNCVSDIDDEQSMLQINVDANKAAKVGYTQATVGQALSRAINGQKIGQLSLGDQSIDVLLRSQKPVASVKELGNVLLPPTQAMNGQAVSDALDKVSKKSDQLSADATALQTDAYDKQVKQLQDAKKASQKAVANLKSQLKKQQSALKKLQGQLDALKNLPAGGPPPYAAASQAYAQLADGVMALTQVVASLSQGIAQAQAGVKASDAQLKALQDSRKTTLDAQAKQKKLTQQSKDAQKTKAKPIKLSSIAAVTTVAAPAKITRVDSVRAATLTASVEVNDLGATTTQLQDGIAKLKLPDGVSVRIGGVSQQQQESFQQLGLAMAVAIAIVYLIMVATFGSLLQPLILLVAIPFAATGALGLSLLTDTALGVPSMIGLLMLIGIVVTNAIVLIDLVNQHRKRGEPVRQALRDGARLRVRPIVMTALATIFALFPMSLGLTGGGIFISRPLAIVVMGGLVSSTLLTLVIVPVLYDLIEGRREKGEAKRAERRRARDAAESGAVPGAAAADAAKPSAATPDDAADEADADEENVGTAILDAPSS